MTDAPLAGCRVLVTRPPAQADALCAAIESAGGVAVRFPVLSIVGRAREAIEAELGDEPADIVVFVSVNAVRFGLPALAGSDALIAAIGPATAAALAEAGCETDIAPAAGFDSEALLSALAAIDVDGKRVLIVRGDGGRELLAGALQRRGADVRYLQVYQRERFRHDDGAIEDIGRRFAAGEIDVVTILSVETLRHLLALLPAAARERLRETPLVAPGDRVIQTACALVPGVPAIKAAGPRPADILNALIDWRHFGQSS